MGAVGGVCSKARAAAMVAAALLHACAAKILSQSPREFLAHLWASRYAPLYGALHEGAAAGMGAIADCLGTAALRELPAHAPERDPALLRRLTAYAEAVASIVLEPDAAVGTSFEGRTFERAVAAELVADFTEELFGWACGAEGAWRLLRILATTSEFDEVPGGLSAFAMRF